MNVPIIIVLYCVSAVIMFQQSAYVIHHDHAELVSTNKSLVSVRLLNVKPNRTYRAYTVYFRTRRTFDGNSVKVNLAADAILNNVPKLRLFQFDIRICWLLRTRGYGIDRLFQTSNLTECPINAGYYAIENFNVNDGALPPNIPPGKYRITLTFYFQEYLIAQIYIFCEFVYNMKH